MARATIASTSRDSCRCHARAASASPPARAATSRSRAARSPRRIRSATASTTAGGGASSAVMGCVRVASDSPGHSASNGCGSSPDGGVGPPSRAPGLARLLARRQRLARLLAARRGDLRALARRLRLRGEPCDPGQRRPELRAAAREEALRLAGVGVEVVDRVEPRAGGRLGRLGIGGGVARGAEAAMELVLRDRELAGIGRSLGLVEEAAQRVVGTLGLAERLGCRARVLARRGSERAALLDEAAWGVAGIGRRRAASTGEPGPLAGRRLAPVGLRPVDRQRDGATRHGGARVGDRRPGSDREPGGGGPDVDGAHPWSRGRDRGLRAADRRPLGRRERRHRVEHARGHAGDGDARDRGGRRRGQRVRRGSAGARRGRVLARDGLGGSRRRGTRTDGYGRGRLHRDGDRRGRDAGAWAMERAFGSGRRSGPPPAPRPRVVGTTDPGPSFQAPSSGDPGTGTGLPEGEGSESVVLRRGLTEFGLIVTRTCPRGAGRDRRASAMAAPTAAPIIRPRARKAISDGLT